MSPDLHSSLTRLIEAAQQCIEKDIEPVHFDEAGILKDANSFRQLLLDEITASEAVYDDMSEHRLGSFELLGRQ